MTLRTTATNNTNLIRQLQEYGVVTKEEIANAMLATDRKYYSLYNPYVDSHQSIGYGANISAPHVHAFVMEYLREHLRPGAHVLDVGSGSGYLTACFYRFIQAKGDNENTKVVGIEHQAELVNASKDNLNADDTAMLESGKVVIVEGDGRKGWLEHAPYAAIYVGAASPETPHKLFNQLAIGGRLIASFGRPDGPQIVMLYDKDVNANMCITTLMLVRYALLSDRVPLMILCDDG